MKKNKYFYINLSMFVISIVLALFISFNIFQVKADSGFDSSWDSGGSYDSGSSYSSDYGSSRLDGTGVGGSFDPATIGYTIYFLVAFVVYFIVTSLVYPNKGLNKIPFLFTSFCIILNGLISYLVFNPIYSIIITVSLFVVLIAAKFNSFINKIFKGEPLFGKEKEETYKKLDYQMITEQLPNLDVNNFYNEAFNIYKNIQLAWMDNDIERVRNIISDEMFNTYKMQLETLKVKNQQNIMKDIVLRKIYITSIRKENNKEIIDVIMNVTCKDYLIDINTKEVLRGDKNKICYYEYKLSYIRTTNVYEINMCPNCGSPIENGQSTKCSYCNSIITKSTDKFVLIDKKMLNQR